MDIMFSDNDRKEFDIWISKRLEEKYSWNQIENLCVPQGEFSKALERLIDDEMWPEEMDYRKWKQYVEYYKKIHPSVVISKEQEVVGIDKNGLNNTFSIPTGAASSWEQYNNELGK